MTDKPLFTPTADGTAYDIQPAGVLILLASEINENPGLHKNGRIQGHIDAMLTAARAGGLHARRHSGNAAGTRGGIAPGQGHGGAGVRRAAGDAALGTLFDSMRNGGNHGN